MQLEMSNQFDFRDSNQATIPSRVSGSVMTVTNMAPPSIPTLASGERSSLRDLEGLHDLIKAWIADYFT